MSTSPPISESVIVCPPLITEKVRQFEEHFDTYTSGDYSEAQLRVDFLNPLLEALGWDVDNRAGYAEAYRDVVYEDALKVGGTSKAPDYGFYIGGRAAGGGRKFFLEAKKPSVAIRVDPKSAFQLRRYAYSAELPLSILTTFREFIAYDTRIKPSSKDGATTAAVLTIKYTEYVERWHEIASVFSRNAILRGAFDKFAQGKRKKGIEPLGESFLKDIEGWRKVLAQEIARNNEITVDDLNFAVQRTIDRILFLRICEDRGIEQAYNLKQLLNGDKVYERLVQVFHGADDRYNSGIFHFPAAGRKPDPERIEPPDDLTPRLTISDKPLQHIIRGLYDTGKLFTTYAFAVIPPEILGHVYEQFLGKVITLRSNHSVKIEEKPEVRKAGGVYYTPVYIVDYIVKNTVGKLLDGKTPEDAAKARILDPASGSGSFLIGAYQFLLDWHLRWYLGNKPEEHCKGKNPALMRIHSPSFSEEPGTSNGRQSERCDYRLTTQKRKDILINSIFGVDIDPQAVEVTKLNLLLKVLEGESQESVNAQLKFLHQRALPDLGRNIKCGNSLISTDIIGTDSWNAMTDAERASVSPFDYERAFPQVFRSKKGRGFDAVIGNPPWGAWLNDGSLAYLRDKYERVIDRMVDTYIYLIDRGIQVKRTHGLLGFIVPATVLNQVDATLVRRLMLSNTPQTIIGLGKDIFTKKVLNTSAIVVVGGDEGRTINLGDYAHLAIEDRAKALGTTPAIPRDEWLEAVEADACLTFQLAGRDKAAVLTRLRSVHPSFSSILFGSIERGVSPDVAAAHVISDQDLGPKSPEPEVLRRSISGPRIGRYREPIADQWIVYTTRNTPIEEYPRARAHLKKWESKNTCREVRDNKHPIWSLHRPRKSEIFDSPKFIGLTTTKTIEVVYDAADSLCVTDAMYVFKTQSGLDYRIVMAIVSSKLFLFLYRVSNMGDARVIPQVKAAKLEPLPFPAVVGANPKVLTMIASLADAMLSLQKRLAADRGAQRREQIQREIDATDREIDQLVYQLYGLTDDEIAIVEAEVT